jgi:hypothetical protein
MARRWFAYLPTAVFGGRDVEGVELPEGLDEAATVEFAEGTAIRSEHLTLEQARAAFTRILPPGVDVTLYPCDE